MVGLIQTRGWWYREEVAQGTTQQATYGALALSGVGLYGFKSLPSPKFCNSKLELDSNPEKGFFVLEAPLACRNKRHHEFGNELSPSYEGLLYHTF